jgi:glucose-6-phosphate 1-epimerase
MSILRTEAIVGYPIFEIQHPTCCARIALQGAHLMEWTPAGQQTGLYLSPQAVYEAGKAIRGGVPICWPWFGPHPTDPTLPMHGFVRNRLWEMVSATEAVDGVELRFSLADSAETRQLWPHAFQLELTMRLGATMELALRMTNTDSTAVTITSALHTYLSVGDITKVAIHGLDGAEYQDRVGPPRVCRQAGVVKFTEEVDREYITSSKLQVDDPALARCWQVEGNGSECTVVWNPWEAKSRRLADLPDDDYHHFVCVETANSWRDEIELAPGATHTLGTLIRSEACK